MKDQRFMTWSHRNVLRRKVKECVVCFSGSEKKHLTVALAATADGQMLPPMIIGREKTVQTIRDLKISPGFIVKTQRKLVWMTIWRKFELKRYDLNIFRLSVRG